MNNINYYSDKSSSNPKQYFRNITGSTNGSCGYVCDAHAHYDYVTGLGTPLTVHF